MINAWVTGTCLAPQTDLCTLLLLFVLCCYYSCTSLFFIANLLFEFPYKKIQYKVNFLRQSLVHPVVNWKKYGGWGLLWEDNVSSICCCCNLSLKKTFNTWQGFCIMPLVVIDKNYRVCALLYKETCSCWNCTYQTEGLHASSTRTLRLTLLLILLHIEDRKTGMASIHNAATLAGTTAVKICNLIAVLSSACRLLWQHMVLSTLSIYPNTEESMSPVKQ